MTRPFHRHDLRGLAAPRPAAAVTVGAVVVIVLLVIGINAVLGGGAQTGGHPSDTKPTAGAGGYVPAHPSTTASTVAPTRPPARVCGDTTLLKGPSRAPKGAVSVPAGTDASPLDQPDTTYWFAPGTHTLRAAEYSQFRPGQGDTYIGAPGAVLDGQGRHPFAIAGTAPNVTVEYLTIEHFTPPGQQAAVNQGGQPGWHVHNVTVVRNTPGAGVMLGSHNVLTGSCLADNGQYGFQVYSTLDASPLTGGPQDVTVEHNEVAGNDTYGWEVRHPGCGCSGGAKFWRVDGATIKDNYIHDNHWTGLWADTNNTGFLIAGNYISSNEAAGIAYEISYNAKIVANTLVRNGIVDGARGQNWMPAIYISESGGDARVPGRYSGVLDVVGNVLRNDWGGVVLWEDSNRFCGNGSAPECTLVDPSVYTAASCSQNLPTAAPGQKPDYFDNCRWKTQNVLVAHNTFVLDTAVVGNGCSKASQCGLTGIFSNFGSTAPYKGWVVPDDISSRQNNHFRDNAYRGGWYFDGLALGEYRSWRMPGSGSWSTGFHGGSGSGTFPAQDQGSTFSPVISTAAKG